MNKQNSNSDGFKKEGRSQGYLLRLHWLSKIWLLADISWKTRLVFTLLLLTNLVAIFGSALFIVLARAEQGVQDQYNRTIGLRKIYQNVITRASIIDMRVCACQPDRTERVTLPGGFETTVFVYDPGGDELRPGIVLIHGNVWMGQRLSTYRLVAHSLKVSGFIVLSFDKVGFGASEDPFGQGPTAVPEAYDHTGQTRWIVDYLIENTSVDPGRITLLGHSGGVTQALELGQRYDQISSVVAWLAPFAPVDEYEVQTNQEYLDGKFHATYRMIYDKDVPEWFQWDMTQREWEDPSTVWAYFRRENHKPLIIVLGENDQSAAHHGVYSDFEILAEPKELIFVKGADHYLNTAQSLRWVFYDGSIVDELVKGLVTYLNFITNLHD